MSGRKKKRTLKREITLLTMATSFGALVLFGTVMIVMFFCVFSGEYQGGYGKYPPEYPSELSVKNAVYSGRGSDDPPQFHTAGFF